ncbi:MAG: GNAT family N-acetyltransferase [Anaerolineae bacterium]|nr:GNAT family N-acetyltransferase [Anaerolineae bacterium]
MVIAQLLRGKTVCLTALTEADLPAAANWYQDAAFLRHLDAEPAAPRSAGELRPWLDAAQKSPNDYLFAIRSLAGATLLGYVALDGILWPHGVAGFSIAIGASQHRGQGYGREALTLLLQFAFDELNLYRIQLTVFSYNQNAIALYEKLGFHREGVFRQFLRRDGQRYDMFLYGLLEPEWRALAVSPSGADPT